MEPPVNFDNLHSVTRGDKELETSLFTAFVSSTAICLKELGKALASGDDSLWRQQAHAFKGNCYILGAGRLADLCAAAQADCHATLGEKQVMLETIKTEHARVCDALNKP